MEWARDPYGIEQARQFCADARAGFDAGRDFTALLGLAAEDRIIGSASILMRDEAVPVFELGYWVHTGHTGRGYATEAAAALTRLAFEDGGRQARGGTDRRAQSDAAWPLRNALVSNSKVRSGRIVATTKDD